MLAKFFKTLSYWIRSWFGKAQKVIADPIRDSQFQIEDAEKAKDEFEGRIAKLLASNRKLERDLISRRQEASKYLQAAQNAAAVGNQDDARRALTRKVSLDHEIAKLQQDLVSSKTEAESLKNDLEMCEARIDNAKRNSTRFAARLESANIRQAISSNKSDLSNAFNALDELERQANEAVDMADAHAELKSGPESLLEKYETTGHDKIVDEQLALLMAPTKE